MGQFSSTRSGPPPEALLHRAEPARSVVPELHGGRKRGPRRRASGDLAHTVASEHATASVNGAPPQPYVLRVTTVFRREHGGWKIVHRHADPRASESASELMEQLSPLIVRRHQARAGQQCRLARGPHAYHPVLRAIAGPCR